MKAFFRKIISIIMSFLHIFGFSSAPAGNNGSGGQPVETVVELSVDNTVRYQTISGFGTSACWWSQDVGASENADKVAELLYSKEGLGLNIYRYNVGAGEKDNPNTRLWGNRATESFYCRNASTGAWGYDFTRDAASQRMLEKCLEYGCIDTVVLFANSPHYSMTRSGQATGGKKSYYSNLAPENYGAFADYMITIARYFIEKGVPVKLISPVNEPQWEWGGKWVGQEGCHYEPDEIFALMKVFAQRIRESGLDIKLAAPESGEISGVTLDWFARLAGDPDVSDVLGSLSYHSYWSDGDTYKRMSFGNSLEEAARPFPVDMTEWCELPLNHGISDMEGVMLTAKTISQDIILSNVNSWSFWLGVNNYSEKNGDKWSDALLTMNGDASEITVCDRYYALAHFSKFITPGSVRISSGKDDGSYHYTDDAGNVVNCYAGYDVSAFETPEGKTVVVIVNTGNERVFVLGAVNGAENMEVYQTAAGYKLKSIYSGSPVQEVSAPANSITTVVFG